MKKIENPKTPAADATESEREAYRVAKRRYLAKHRNVTLNAKGLKQEEDLILIMSLSPEQQKQMLTARLERVRNLLGGDVTIDDSAFD